MTKHFLCSLAAVFFLLNLNACRSWDSSGSREPAQVRATKASDLERMSSAQLVDELISQAKLLKQTLPTLGNFRGQMLTHFIDAAQRRKARYPQDYQGNVLGLFNTMKRISLSDSIQDLMSVDSAETAAIAQFMVVIADRAALVAKVDTERQRVLDTAADISFLRFFMNRAVDNLNIYVSSLPGGQTRIELAKIYKDLSKLKGNIQYLSKAMKDANDRKDPKIFSVQLNFILRASVWPTLRKVYIPLAGSNDIDGMAQDLEMAESIRLGLDSIYFLVDALAKAPPLKVSSLNVTDIDSQFSARKPAQESEDEVVEAAPAKLPAMKYNNLVLIGNVPGQYVGKDKNSYSLAVVEIKDRVIVSIKALTEAEVAAASKPVAGKQIIVLKNGANYDVMYPGFIDLHNHTKQNNLPVWGQAKGQFENRFEWRGWGDYTKSVSQNMNPWIGYGKPIECAAFRWSELKTMIIGTTYLQGPSNCVENFGIQRVEDGKAFISQKASVQAPTDLIYPNEMQFVWTTLRADIQRGMSYEQALAAAVNKYCPSLQGISASTVNEASGLKILKDKDILTANCPEPLPKGMIRYVYWIHPTVAGKKNYLKDPKHSAVIAHLAEGRRTDSYNMREMELIQMLGLDMPHLNFVHGVGISPNFLPRLASKQIGLVWSPFSNLLLYAETLDILSAHRAGVLISIGSDWLPTGSKGVLEEVKLAAQYIDKDAKLKAVFNDEYLFRMMTENPAKMINHWENIKDASGRIIEAGVGQIAVGSMGSIIVASLQDPNPFTNIVRKTDSENINLVVVDGNVVYGNESLVKQAGISRYEVISEEYAGIERSISKSMVPAPSADSGKAIKVEQLIKLGQVAASLRPPVSGACKFTEKKVFVTPDTVTYVPELSDFRKQSGIDMDKFSDISKLIAVSALTQSKNVMDAGGDPRFALTYFPPLYSCNDAAHTARIRGMVSGQSTDEWTSNVSARSSLRSQQKLGTIPKKLGEAYK